ncbi:MAG: IS66 family transposase [Gaiellales bacterium]
MGDPERERYEAEIERLRAIIVEQAALIEQLRSRVAEHEARLRKDSGNSSLPPSRDRLDRRARRAQERAERKAARKAGEEDPARKPGKQPGAPGSTLCRRSADRTAVHRPSTCRGCGRALADAPVVGRATRQVLEIPEPHLEATDHVAERRRCPCGHETAAAFPPEATGPVCWGPRAKAVGAYLLARQHLPLERGAEAMAVLFDAPMGEGTLAGLLPDAARRLEGFVERVKSLLGGSPVVHADETPIRVGVSPAWAHTVSTEGLTLLAHHPKRGIEGILEIGVLGGYRGTIVHDGLATYDREELAGAAHAQCGAHLARHLEEAARALPHKGWATDMLGVLADAKEASETSAAAGLPAVPGAIAQAIRHRYRTALTHAFAGLPPGPPPPRKHRGGWSVAERDSWNLAARMHRHEDQVLRLLDDTRVPFTNNAAERPLRPVKLHDKISGTFRSVVHAEAFLVVRSYLGTGAKHGRRALQLLTDLWTPTGAWLPSVAVPDTS